MSKKYGNDNYWCFLEDWDSSKPIEIWHDIGSKQSEVIAHATDRFNARQIVDSLITADNVNDGPEKKLTKKELVFLAFVESQCPEPWSTMASNAILWNEKDTYNNLKNKFNEIY